MNSLSLRRNRILLGALVLALLAALAFAHFAADAKRKSAGPDARPALWKLADKDTTIYLFGTIHMLPKGIAWQSQVMTDAIEKSDQLVLEVGNLEDQTAIAKAMMGVAITPGLPAVVDRVPADRHEKLKKLSSDAGVPLAMMQPFENWAVALTLASGSLKELGLDPKEGAEEQLRQAFVARGKPIIGLETAEQQFGYFDSMSEGAQKVLLMSTIDESGDVRASFDKMITAWRTGDQKKVALSFDDELQLSPELYDKLLRQRNANWAQWIDDRMDKPGTIFVAVGAGHLAGKASVQNLLAQRKLKVKRIQ